MIVFLATSLGVIAYLIFNSLGLIVRSRRAPYLPVIYSLFDYPFGLLLGLICLPLRHWRST